MIRLSQKASKLSLKPVSVYFFYAKSERDANGLAKFVHYNEVLLYQGPFPYYFTITGGKEIVYRGLRTGFNKH